jgi:DNA end-binding protein Ku
MAPRSNWKGYLKLSLVSCPVKLHTATTPSKRLSFNLLHKDSHERIQMKPFVPGQGTVERSDLVKGYAYEKDQYVVLTQDDFDKIKIESDDTMVIERFIDADAVDEVYLDSPYYMVPDGPVAEEAYRVIHKAMRAKNKVALSRIVISGRERLVLISCRDKGFLVSTLRWADEVRNSQLYFDEISEKPIDPEMMALAGQLIDQKVGAFAPSEFTDRYEEALLEVVRAKMQGQEPVIAKAPERGRVVNLMDALKQSLASGQEFKPAAPSKPRKGGKQAAAEGPEKDKLATAQKRQAG